ncbi:MAG: hydrogenase maturation protein HypF [Campylobacterota bacterium]|nr:hydrogenase maturation protein HypF [Campylobacterota bacterium]
MSYKIIIKGIVQGVGFRPFIYNQATLAFLVGYVTNNEYGVEIVLDACREDVDEFVKLILKNAPSVSKIDSLEVVEMYDEKTYTDFTIKESKALNALSAHIPSDIAVCKRCQAQMQDSTNARYGYAFISCTNCGPRYSIIKHLPYDRQNTSMGKFKMCKSCESEYKNPNDVRFHAQTIGCYDCGPTLKLLDKDAMAVETKDMIEEVVKYINDGKILAIKGIGGYHLVCDATNDTALSSLRERKKRPSKPFAVMVKDIEAAKAIALIDEDEEQLLCSNQTPIVLLKKSSSYTLSYEVSKNVSQVGLFLAYTPLHHLLLKKLNKPIVATSANISGGIICSSYDEIMKLNYIWDYCLDNDRDIINRCDDSVAFVENKKTFMLRSARSYSPMYLSLPKKASKKILSLGANQKSTVSIAIENGAIVSHYIGDLDDIYSVKHYKESIEALLDMYDFTPEVIVYDKHPFYESTKYAKELKAKNDSLELYEVQHHYAHILSTMGANKIYSKVLGVSFDGTGYGDDGNLWGGEFLVCDLEGYERVGQFKYFKLLGGEKAIKEPRRVALSFLFELYGKDALNIKNATTASFSEYELKTLFRVWQNSLNAPLSSSCGRLFDAVASITGIVQICSYEGESGLLLESLYDEDIEGFYGFEVVENEIDFSMVFEEILNEKEQRIAVSKFFNTIVEIIIFFYKRYSLPLVLGGGVFQNRILLRLLMKRAHNIIVPNNFLSNDASISYGQLIGVK